MKSTVGTEKRSWVVASCVSLLLFVIFIFLFTRVLGRKLERDEEQFVSAGALLLRFGFIPYRDYPFFHLPNLAFIFSALFSTNGRLLLTARCFNLACASLLIILVCITAARRMRGLVSNHWAIGAGVALILSLDPFFRFTAGRAWNHDLPVLLSVLALLGLRQAFESERSGRWFLICGGLLGLAIGSRLSFALVPAAFALALIIFPSAGSSRGGALFLFFAGLIVTLIPSIALCLAAPDQFVFDNLIYNGPLNSLYQQITAPGKATLLYKTLFPLKALAKSPSTLALVAGFIYFGVRPWYQAGWRSVFARREVVIICLILPCLFIGGWAPILPHRQYYYSLVPFILLGTVYAIAHERISRRLIGGLTLLVVGLGLIESGRGISRLKATFHLSQWGAIQVHERGMELRKLVQTGPILTIYPIYPLEGELSIYRELATGPFAWRTGSLLDPPRATAFHILNPRNLDAFVRTQPPSGVLTKTNLQKVDESLLSYLHRHNYSPRVLDRHQTLWLPGMHEQEKKVEVRDQRTDGG